MPEHAIIIPHFNDVDRLSRLLDALVPQLERLPGQAEIIIVDNGSSADLSALQSRWPMVRWLQEPAKGAANARNTGVAHSRAPALFFIDADVVPAPDWLETAIRVKHSAAIVGGRVEPFDETPPPRSGAEAFETLFAFRQRDYVSRQGFSVTANLLTSRAVFDAVGGFHHGYSEDLDWCHRARALGHDIAYADALVVGHPNRADWPALRRKWQRLTEEGCALAFRRPAGRLVWGLRALAVLASIAAHAPRFVTAPQLRSPGERWRGLATLVRLRARRCGWMLRQAISGQISLST